jgi:plastocyanin
MRTRLPFLALLGLLVACSSPAPTGDATGDSDGSPDAALAPISVTVSDFMIEPNEFEAAGPTVTVEAINDGPTPHNFTVRDSDGNVVLATADLSTGESEVVSAELEPGEYTIFCSLAGHESLGMSGTLTVVGG